MPEQTSICPSPEMLPRALILLHFPFHSLVMNSVHHCLHGKDRRGKTKTMEGQVIGFLLHTDVLYKWNSIITINRAPTCKSFSLHNYTRKSHTDPIRKRTVVTSSDGGMFSGKESQRSSRWADYPSNAASAPPMPLWSRRSRSAALCHAVSAGISPQA